MYPELKTADSVMESNAVVVSNFVGFRVPFFLIRGTKRIQMPLGVRDALPIWPDSEIAGRVSTTGMQRPEQSSGTLF